MAETNDTTVETNPTPAQDPTTPATPEPPPAPTPEPVPAPAPKAATTGTKVAPKPVVSAPKVADNSFEALVTKTKASGTVSQRGLIAALEKYMTDLQPGKPIDGDLGARLQYGLWRTIVTLTTAAPKEEFKDLWSILLGFFNQYRDGVFHDRYVYRFSEHWVNSDAELSAFQRIINLIKLTADPATRAAGLKQVDLDRTLQVGFNDEARNRLISFYS